MVIGALVDAGADLAQMEEELKKLEMDGEYILSQKTVNKNGIPAVKFDVNLVDAKGSAHEHSNSHLQDNDHHIHHHDIVTPIMSTALTNKSQK